MTSPIYIDLLVTNDDITFGEAGEPQLIFDRDCIAQDIKHMIRDSGLLVRMIAERDAGRVAMLAKQIEIKVEEDTRIKPGTAQMVRTELETFYLLADTVEFGPIRYFL